MNTDDTTISKNAEWKPSIEYIYMKTRRAKIHLDALNAEIDRWVKSRPYSIVEKDDVDAVWHYFEIQTAAISEDIPLIAGDFINCLRSSLDNLAWGLVHLSPETIPSDEKSARRVIFPICDRDDTYIKNRSLFPSAIADVLDSFQPDDRQNAFRFHPLWQLDKIWNLDKHRTIPINCGNFQVDLPKWMTGTFFDYFDDRIR